MQKYVGHLKTAFAQVLADAWDLSVVGKIVGNVGLISFGEAFVLADVHPSAIVIHPYSTWRRSAALAQPADSTCSQIETSNPSFKRPKRRNLLIWESDKIGVLQLLLPISETELWNHLHLEQTLSQGDLVSA